MALHSTVLDRAAQFVLMLDALDTHQRQKISELGFDSLFKLQPILVSRSLINALIKVYQPDTKSFQVGHTNIELTCWDAQYIMGLRNKGPRIDFENKIPNESLIDMFANADTENMSFNTIKTRIRNIHASDENFVRCFVLLMVAGLLAPTIDDRIPENYINIVDDVSQVSHFNWAEFTISFLHRSLSRQKLQKERLQANLILLQLWYYEHIQEMPASKKLENCYPLMSKWTREKVALRECYERRHGRFHGQILLHLKSEGELPTKTPEKRADKKRFTKTIILISDDEEDKSEEANSQKPAMHKQKKKKEYSMKRQASQSYESVVPKGGLTIAEMAAVEYIRNVKPDDEVVRMSGGSSGELTLKGYHMHCLVPPLGDSGLSKWIYDEIVNCFMAILDPNRHGLLRVMTMDTFNTRIFEKPDTPNCDYHLDLQRWKNDGLRFLEHDLVFFPINHCGVHWYVVVLNMVARRFQVLDSIVKKDSEIYAKRTHNLRVCIQFVISLALVDNFELRHKYNSLDVTEWPMDVIKTPQQADGFSCGIYIMKYIETWNGNNSDSLEVHADLFRKQLVYKLIFSKENTLKEVQDKVMKNS